MYLMLKEKEMEDNDNNLQGLLATAAQYKNEAAELDRQLKVSKGNLALVQKQILETLNALEIDSVKGHGFMFYKTQESSVKTPKTLEDKRALFDFLREKGIFDEMVSVNSQTLNSLYKNLAQEALEQGVLEFNMPGIAEPTNFTKLKMRKS